jgi:tetratricopeptide (TPR) repeat protein
VAAAECGHRPVQPAPTARAEARRALARARAAVDTDLAASAQVDLGIAALGQGRLEIAAARFEAALRLCEDLADDLGTGIARGNLGIVFRRRGQPAQAIPLITEGLTASCRHGHRASIACWLGELGLCRHDLDDHVSARALFEASLDVARRQGDAEGTGLAALYLGVLDLELGNTQAAAERFAGALQGEALGASDHVRGALLTNLGLAYHDLARFEDAGAHYEAAEAAFQLAGDRRGIARVRECRGTLLLETAHNDRAVELLRAAVQPEGRDAAPADRAIALNNLGRAHAALGDAARAYESYTRAATAVQDAGLRWLEPIVRCNLGDAALALGRTDEASGELRTSILLARRRRQWQAEWRARWILARHRAAAPADWRATYRLLGRAIRAIESHRALLTVDALRENILADKAKVYDLGVEAALRQGFRDQAYRWAELERCRALADVLERDDRCPFGCPADLAERWSVVQDRLQTQRWASLRAVVPTRLGPGTEARVLPGSTGNGATVAAHVPAGVHEEYEAVLRELQRFDPEFLPLSSASPASIADVTALLPTDPPTALVDLVATESGTAAFMLLPGARRLDAETAVWIDTFAGARQRDLVLGDGTDGSTGCWHEVLRGIEQGRGFVEAVHGPAMDRVLGELWPALLAPIHERLRRHGIRRLLIVPHRSLRLVPLHAVYRPCGGLRRYVIEDYEVSYLPTASLLGVCTRRAAAAGDGHSILVVAVGASLTHAMDDVESVRAVTRAEERVELLGAEATVGRVLDALAGRQYVHLACHGRYDWLRPRESILKLHDGTLTLNLLEAEARMRGTRLVVLGACETGISGTVGQADAYVGFPAGCLVAGAAAAVGTLWSVGDEATAQLMRGFYARHLGCAVPIVSALCEAQLAMRRCGAHPYYWAGVVSVGP